MALGSTTGEDNTEAEVEHPGDSSSAQSYAEKVSGSESSSEIDEELSLSDTSDKPVMVYSWTEREAVDFGESQSRLEAQYHPGILQSIHQNCHHCVASGNRLVKKDPDGKSLMPLQCHLCNPRWFKKHTKPRHIGADEPPPTRPCCQTVSGILAYAQRGCPLCGFLLKQLSEKELKAVVDSGKDGILRHVWGSRPGSNYRSFTYYYGCDPEDLSDFVARKSVHFSIDGKLSQAYHVFRLLVLLTPKFVDSASELGLQEEGLETDEEATSEVVHENSKKVPSDTTNSEACMLMARGWLRHCRSNHGCYEQSLAMHRPKVNRNNSAAYERPSIERRLPTRLLYLDTASSIRLCSTANLPHGTEYMTLSHCWGKSPTMKLRKNSLSSFLQNIPLNALTQTFKDAILITRKWFHCRYLWIDSLCIIQDDVHDWRTEAALMGSVYIFSKLNIAAAHGSNGLAGCFSQRDPMQVARTITKAVEGLPGRIYEFMEETEEVWQRCVDSAPLHQRGWVFQERMLAPRTLHFCQSQVIWGCLKERSFEGMNSYRGKFDDLRYMSWEKIVEHYTKSSFTCEGDMLVALSGLARAKQSLVQSPYIAGLWKTELPRNLLWKVVATTTDSSIPSYPRHYRAPSWSWAAVNGQIDLEHPLAIPSLPPILRHPPLIKKLRGLRKTLKDIVDLTEVLDVCIDHVGDIYGQVTDGFITFKAGLLPLHISPDVSLSIIEGKNRMHRTSMQNPKLTGESYFDVLLPFREFYYGMPIMGVWKKRRTSQKSHIYLEGLLLEKVVGEQGTYRRLGTFIMFGQNGETNLEVAWPLITAEDYIKEEGVHTRGFRQYVLRVI